VAHLERSANTTRRHIFLFLLLFTACVRHENQLITLPGKYAAPEGKLTLDIVVPDPGHLGFRVDWKTELRNGGSSLFALGSTKGPFPPVVAGQWAFCIVGRDEVWLFDGGIYSQYKGRGNELFLTQSCTDPTMADRAPEILKKWVAQTKKTSA
jgi:hypothetical protein